MHRDFSVAIAPILDRIEDLERPRGILFSSEHGLDRLVLRKELWCRTVSKDVDLHPLLDQIHFLTNHHFVRQCSVNKSMVTVNASLDGFALAHLELHDAVTRGSTAPPG